MNEKAVRTFGLALVVLLAVTARAGAQLPSLDEFHIRVFDAGDGLPAGDVRHLAQADNGYIYVATPRGLQRFDGYSFRRVPLPGFRTEFVELLLHDRRGRIWVVSAGNDLGYLDQGQFRALPAPPVPLDRFADLPDGSVWFAGPGGLTRVSTDPAVPYTTFTTADGLPHDSVDSVVDLGDGAPIVVTERQLARMRTDRSTGRGIRFEPFGPRFAEALSVRVDSAGLWLAGRALDGTFFVLRFGDGRFEQKAVADRRSAAFLWTPDQVASMPRRTAWHTHALTRVSAPDLPRHWTVDHAMVGRDGTQWLSLLGADEASYLLTRRRPGRLDTIPLLRDEPRAIRHFIEDHEGSIWVATNRGLLQLSSRKVFALGASHGLSERFTTSVIQTRDGAVWIGTWGGGLHRFANGRLAQRFSTANGLVRNEVRALHEAADGTLWIGTLHSFASIGRDGLVTRGRSDVEVRAFAETPDGVLWVGTANQLLHRSARGFVPHRPEFWRDKSIWALHVARDSALWIGTEQGLFRLTSDSLRAFGATDGLRGPFVVSIAEEPDGTLWFGTYEHGLHRYRGGRMAAITTSHGLHHDGVWRMLEDGRGGVWMSSDQGVFRMAHARLHEVADSIEADRPTPPLAPLVFTEAEGLPNSESNRASPAGWRLRDGRLVFNNLSGVAVIDPARAIEAPAAPRVVLQRVMADGRPLETQSGSEVPRGTRQITFDFVALSFVAPEQNRYRYRLDGYDDTWVDGGTQPHATYTNLAPARYTFRVQSAVGMGEWGDAQATHAVIIHPFVWQTWWFRLLAVTGIVALLAAAYRYRVARLLEMERLRGRIAADLHDDVGSNLSSIALLSQMLQGRAQLGDVEQRQLQRIHNAADETIAALRDVIWLVDPGHRDYADLVVRMRALAASLLDGRDLRFDAGEPFAGRTLGMPFLRAVLLIYKEALTNVARHSGAGRVGIEIRDQQGTLVLCIHDDGAGFDPVGGNGDAPRGRGLENMRRRAEQAGGRLDIVSAPGQGTRVTFTARMS